jgi:hypothetical protein
MRLSPKIFARSMLVALALFGLACGGGTNFGAFGGPKTGKDDDKKKGGKLTEDENSGSTPPEEVSGSFLCGYTDEPIPDTPDTKPIGCGVYTEDRELRKDCKLYPLSLHDDEGDKVDGFKIWEAPSDSHWHVLAALPLAYREVGELRGEWSCDGVKGKGHGRMKTKDLGKVETDGTIETSAQGGVPTSILPMRAWHGGGGVGGTAGVVDIGIWTGGFCKDGVPYPNLQNNLATTTGPLVNFINAISGNDETAPQNGEFDKAPASVSPADDKTCFYEFKKDNIKPAYVQEADGCTYLIGAPRADKKRAVVYFSPIGRDGVATLDLRKFARANACPH